MYAVFVKYALINFRSPNQYTISVDLLSITISIRIISINISKQSKHRDQQAKEKRESALSCIKNYALCCKAGIHVLWIFLFLSWFLLWVSQSLISLYQTQKCVIALCVIFSVFLCQICLHTCVYRGFVHVRDTCINLNFLKVFEILSWEIFVMLGIKLIWNKIKSFAIDSFLHHPLSPFTLKQCNVF